MGEGDRELSYVGNLASATVGPTLVELRGRHPDPESVREMLDVLGVELSIERGDRAELVATLRSARGVSLFL